METVLSLLDLALGLTVSETLSNEARRFFGECGRRGARKQAATMSDEAKRARARKGGLARQAARRKATETSQTLPKVPADASGAS